MDERLSKMWWTCRHSGPCHTWTNLANILIERSQTQKNNTARFHSHDPPRAVLVVDTENGLVAARGCGDGGVESCHLMGTES